ncbi:HAMP domain-containing protein, partial [Acidovorax sp. HMWF018]|uniref:HAMP domain-containing protein n=3 Tax=Acidovorax TaxID=12916 RepID=UPI0013049FC8
MNVLQNLSIKTRLGIGYVVLTCALILVAIMGIRGESMTQESLDNQVNHLNVIKSLGNRVLDTANARAVSARNLVIAGSKEDADAETRRIGIAHEGMGKALQGVEEALKVGPPETAPLNKLLAQIKNTEAAYGPVALEITRLGSQGEKDAAIKKINEQCRPLLTKLVADIEAFLAESDAISKRASQESMRQFESLRLQLILLSVAMVVFACVLGVATTRSIVRPLNEASQATREFARGNLATPLVAQGKNEIASVVTSMEAMRLSLSNLVAGVRQGSESVSTASAEIAQGNHNL